MSLEPSVQTDSTPAENAAIEPVVTATPAVATEPGSTRGIVEPDVLSPEEIKKLRGFLKKSHKRKFWDAAKSISLLVSMIINVVLIVTVAALVYQVGAIKMTLGSVLGQLDSAFEGLGQAVIQDTIQIDQIVPVRFDLPLNQNTVVTTQAPVPISTQATFSLGQFGSINGTVSLQLPTGLQLPVHLELTVPVSNAIPVVFDQPIAIPLAEKGLGPVVAKLRSALGPIINLVGQLPDRFVIVPQP